jgi:hypothetical protein
MVGRNINNTMIINRSANKDDKMEFRKPFKKWNYFEKPS